MEAGIYENGINDREIVVYADKKLYSKAVILKSLYWYGGNFRTNVSVVDDRMFRISLIPIQEGTDDRIDLNSYLQKLERDLVDFHLREIVIKETNNVRDLLIAKAFAHSGTSIEPSGEIADPVGLER